MCMYSVCSRDMGLEKKHGQQGTQLSVLAGVCQGHVLPV